MKNRILLRNYEPKSTDKVLLDTNILIKLFYPMDLTQDDGYVELYKRLLKSKCDMLITSIQISEYINRCIRFQFAVYKETNNLSKCDYKRDYRSTEDYHDSMDAILTFIKEDITPHFKK